MLPKYSVLPTGFRFIDLSILPDVLSFLACPNCSATNTLKLHDIEHKREGLARFMQIKFEFRDCEFKHSFNTSLQIGRTKGNCSRGIKAMEVKVRAVYDFRSTVVGYIPLTKLCGFLNMPPPMTSDHMMAYLIR